MKALTSISTLSWAAVFSTALLLSPTLLQAQTPENVGVDGGSTTVDDLITSTSRDPLVSTTASLSTAHTHTCVVTASAGTLWGGGPVGVGGRYIFDLTRNGLVALAVGAGGGFRRPARGQRSERATRGDEHHVPRPDWRQHVHFQRAKVQLPALLPLR